MNRPRDLLPMLIAVILVALLAGCGDQGDPAVTDPPTTAVAPTPRPSPTTTPSGTAPAPNERCGNLTITPQSGEGAFDVRVANIDCYQAFALLRSDDGLRSWDCREVERGQDGSVRHDCTSGERRIVFTAGS